MEQKMAGWSYDLSSNRPCALPHSQVLEQFSFQNGHYWGLVERFHKRTFWEPNANYAMPVEFLTLEQETYYGRYAGEPSAEQHG